MSTDKQGKITANGNWISPKARANWVFLLKAQPGKKRDDGTMSEPKFSITLLFDKDADFVHAKKLATDALAERFGDRMKEPAFVAKLRKPFRDQGEKVDEKGALPEGYVAGCIFITATSKNRPGVVDAAGADILEEKDIYSGCFVRASLNAYAYGGLTTGFTPGVAFGLQNVQKLADGDPLGGRSRPQDDFEPVAPSEATASGAAATSIF